MYSVLCPLYLQISNTRDIANHGWIFFVSNTGRGGNWGRIQLPTRQQPTTADFPRSQLALKYRSDTCPLYGSRLLWCYSRDNNFPLRHFPLDLRLDQADRQSSAAANGFLGFSSRFDRLDHSIWLKKGVIQYRQVYAGRRSIPRVSGIETCSKSLGDIDLCNLSQKWPETGKGPGLKEKRKEKEKKRQRRCDRISAAQSTCASAKSILN